MERLSKITMGTRWDPFFSFAGFARAVGLWQERPETLQEIHERMVELKAYAVEQLTTIPDLKVIGSGTAPHVLSVSLVGWPSANIVTDLGSRGICISAGSACHQGKLSHVVKELNLPKREAQSIIRISFGPDTTKGEIDACVAAIRDHHDTRMPML